VSCSKGSPDKKPISTVILAAGIGKRMHSNIPKVLHPILGRPIISFVIDQAQQIGSDDIVVVVGKNAQQTQEILGTHVKYAFQRVPRGTGDAAHKGIMHTTHDLVLILCGDVPLLSPETLRRLISAHRASRADLTLLTCTINDPFGYGRIIRYKDHRVRAVVEETDASTRQKKVKEINAGVYLGSRSLIVSALETLTPENTQGEFYLPDIISIMLHQRKKVNGFHISDETEIMGINTKTQLARAREVIKKQWFDKLMDQGVFIEDPTTTVIDLTVNIGKNVHVRPHTLLEGKTKIKDGTTVGPFAWIRNGKSVKPARNV
jgi:bifunctional UDP-N-acetylglucosamine pyrophosphorylase/glucosamine-1-phosphate N-acetyltransferase